MVDVKREITKEQYEEAQLNGAESLIPDYIKMGYGIYGGATVSESDGSYYLSYSRGDSCD